MNDVLRLRRDPEARDNMVHAARERAEDIARAPSTWPAVEVKSALNNAATVMEHLRIDLMGWEQHFTDRVVVVASRKARVSTLPIVVQGKLTVHNQVSVEIEDDDKARHSFRHDEWNIQVEVL